MSVEAIQQGIAALQAGNMAQGEKLLRQGLEGQNVPGDLRAIGLMWLATTSQSPKFQLQCYQLATEADPANQEAQRRLQALQEAQRQPKPDIPLPPDPLQSQGGATPAKQKQPPPPPETPAATRKTANQEAPRLWEFGVEGGPNGKGTAFMVVRDGLLATTRYVVGDRTEVIVTSRAGHPVDAKVIRSYPQFDLAFIRTRISVPYLRDMTPATLVKPGTPLVADDYTERTERSRCRDVTSKVTPGWIPTNFPDTLPRSFNGAPIMDDSGDLVGMLTRNAARNAGRLFGLHMSVIRRKVEELYTVLPGQEDWDYCGSCGARSKAGAAGLYYCEHCGAVLPHAQKAHRVPHPDAHLYYPTDMRED